MRREKEVRNKVNLRDVWYKRKKDKKIEKREVLIISKNTKISLR